MIPTTYPGVEAALTMAVFRLGGQEHGSLIPIICNIDFQGLRVQKEEYHEYFANWAFWRYSSDTQ
jgi:hypothetical protein